MNSLTSPNGENLSGYIGQNNVHDDDETDVVSNVKRGRERGSRRVSISSSTNLNNFINDCDDDDDDESTSTCCRTYAAPTPGRRSSLPFTPSTSR